MRVLVTAAILLLVGGSHLEAQTTDAATAPQFKIGDTWKFGRTDLWKNQRTDGWTDTVAGMLDGQVRIDGKNERNEEFRNIYTLDGNLIAGRNTLKPFMPLLSFPLNGGKAWEGSYSFVNRQGVPVEVQMKVRVVGRESIAIPAGTFDAFKIESQGTYRRSDATGLGTIRIVYWYAPTTKRIVRQEYQDTTPNGSAWDKHVTVLESYTLAQ